MERFLYFLTFMRFLSFCNRSLSIGILATSMILFANLKKLCYGDIRLLSFCYIFDWYNLPYIYVLFVGKCVQKHAKTAKNYRNVQ